VIQHAWGRSCLYLNPDEIAQEEFGGWDSPEASLQAARKVAGVREECLVTNKSLMFETVFSAPDKIEYIQQAKAAGFFIRLFFICTEDTSINESRIARRREAGGHGVPRDKIISRFSKSIANCATAIKFVDRAYIYDNSVEDADPQLLFRTEGGFLKKIYRESISPWAAVILGACKASS